MCTHIPTLLNGHKSREIISTLLDVKFDVKIRYRRNVQVFLK